MRRLIAATLTLIALSRPSRAQVIRFDDLRPDPQGMPGERRCDRTIDLGRGIRLPVTLTVTARGNGTLDAANLSLRVIDEYDDGQVYEHGLLHVEFADVTGDGLKDLVVTGIYVHTGDKETDPVTREPVTSIYAYAPDERQFRRTFHRGPEIDMRTL